MRNVLFTLLLVGLAAGLFAQAGITTVVGSKHDLSLDVTNTDQVCVFCHTPHQSSAPNIQYPLWNHNLSSTTPYTVYTSNTFQGGPAGDFSGAAWGAAVTSNLCMSCHDGTVSVASLYNDPNEIGADPTIAAAPAHSINPATGRITGMALIGTNLADDHPVNFSYAASDAADPDIVPAASVPAGYLDGTGRVQCASCHEPHKSQDPVLPFMRATVAGSALCLDCHLK